jgi:hypothetical protein
VRIRETPDSPAGIVDAGLLQHREYIRNALQSFPVRLLRQVLQTLDDRRGTRRAVPAKVVRSNGMSAAEMQREIVWRLATLPPEDAEAIAELVQRLTERSQ